MPSLPELQTSLLTSLIETGAAPAAIASGRFPADQHLQVYRNNIFASLTAALQAVYPVITRLVGEGFLFYSADAYIRRHPPHTGNLQDFGARFGDFLHDFEPATSLPYLPDVARLEWAWHEAFHAAEALPLEPLRLASLTPDHYDSLKLGLHPSARLVASPYPLLRIWQANQDGAADQAIELEEGGVQLLVIRRGLTVIIEMLTPGEYALLQSFARGETLAQACEAAFNAEPDFNLPEMLARFVQRATLTNLSLPD